MCTVTGLALSVCNEAILVVWWRRGWGEIASLMVEATTEATALRTLRLPALGISIVHR